MDNELEVIRTQMEDTRSSLADKLEELEQQFRGTVEGATNAVAGTVEAVQETVENVKETVQETMESVKESLDVSKHVERHPWAMFGGAVGVGYLVGCLTGPFSKASAAVENSPPHSPSRNGTGTNGYGAHEIPETSRAIPAEESGPLQVGAKLLKGLAVGTLMGVMREIASRTLPTLLVPDVTGVVDDMTTKLGGKPLRSAQDSADPAVYAG